MKQICIFISWGIAALASSDPLVQVWPNSFPLYSRNIYGENILKPRSPVKQTGPSSGPMQRAQNIPASTRSQHVPLIGSQGSATPFNIQHTRQSSPRSSGPMQRAQNIPSSSNTPSAGAQGATTTRQSSSRSPSPMQEPQNTPSSSASQGTRPGSSRGRSSSPDQPSSRSPSPMQEPQNNPSSNSLQGTRSGPSRGRSSTPDQSQTRQNPTGRYNTVVRGAVLGPAMVHTPGENGQRETEFIPWGRGEFVSASGGNSQRIHAQTFHEPGGRRGEASLGAQGYRAARVTVKAGEDASGQIERKLPLPERQRLVASGQTDSQTIFARPPPQHQYLIGNVKGEGEVKAIANSPGAPAP